MNRNIFRKSEVIAFVEELIQSNAATYEQEEMYLTFKWDGILNKNNQTYKRTIRQMYRLYSEKF
jgi:hypothetical protein